MKKLSDIDFYLVTDSGLSRNGIFSDAEDAVKAGCRIVQYREKDKSTKDMIKEAEQLKKVCEGKAVFLIDDRVDVALAVDADGVHIGQSDIPFKTARRLLGNDKIIGLTVHDVEEALRAVDLGADYVGLAPIFHTDTKEDIHSPCGINMIKDIRKMVSLPLVAVGGIDKTNVVEVIENGADSVVSISAIMGVDDVYGEVKDIIEIIKRCKLK